MNETQQELVKTARIAGVWYLVMAISGVMGFLVFHPQVYTADPEQTLSNLMREDNLARVRLIFEFAIIISQSLTAVWFYRLFKNINNWAALATLIWGTVNSVIILISAISMGSAIKLATSSMVMESKIISIELLSSIISNAWGIGGLFFGLWLIPLGYIITSSERLPAWLGRTLIVGGIGYLVSTFINYLGISGEWVGMLTLPADIGEFWIIGYLLIFGIRPEKE